jgi:hypothetical protein
MQYERPACIWAIESSWEVVCSEKCLSMLSFILLFVLDFECILLLPFSSVYCCLLWITERYKEL